MLLEWYFTEELPFDGEPKVVRGDNAMEFYTAVSPWKLNDSKECIPQIAYLRPAALAFMCSHWQVDKDVLTKDVLLKTHNMNVTMEEMPAFPLRLCSGALILTRDPRDVAISYGKYLGISQQEGVDMVCDDGALMIGQGKPPAPLGSWETWHISWGTDQRNFPITVLRYEDLLRDTEDCVKMVLFAIGETEVDEARVRDAIAACELAKLKKKESEDGFVDHTGQGSFFNTGKAKGWKDVLTLKQIAQINKHCKTMMGQLGYE